MLFSGIWLLVTCGCAAATPDAATETPARGTPTAVGGIGGRLTVFAAASLTDVFRELGTRFERAHPGTEVVFSFGPSSTLAAQVAQGAPADVFASAGPAPMQALQDAGQVVQPRIFAANTLVVAVPAANPGRVASFSDLARPGVKVAVCQPSVPCGELAEQAIRASGIAVTPVSRDPDVRAVLTRVRMAQVDAGLVYATDVRAAGASVSSVPLPSGVTARTRYPVTVTEQAPNRTTGQAFIDFVVGPQGRAVLVDGGFANP